MHVRDGKQIWDDDENLSVFVGQEVLGRKIKSRRFGFCVAYDWYQNDFILSAASSGSFDRWRVYFDISPC